MHLASPEVLLDFAANTRINAALENPDEINRIWEQEQTQSDNQQSKFGTEHAKEDDPERRSGTETEDTNEPRLTFRHVEDRERNQRESRSQEIDNDSGEEDMDLDME